MSPHFTLKRLLHARACISCAMPERHGHPTYLRGHFKCNVVTVTCLTEGAKR